MNRREMLLTTARTLGVCSSATMLLGALSSADSEGAPAKSVLITDQRELVDVLAELIIPPTDTPGAIEAGVPDFIDMIVSDWYTTRSAIFSYQASKDRALLTDTVWQ